MSSTYAGVTFLKGSFFSNCTNFGNTTFTWLPLPSQAIKLGKLLNDPCEIYKGDPPRIAWRKAAYALAQGVGTIPENYPILGDLMKFYRSKGIENDLKLKENQYRLEVDCQAEELDVEEFHSFLWDRYGISPEETDLLKEQLRALEKVDLPILLPFNSLWPKLWADYE